MYVFPHEIKNTDRIYLDADNKAHKIEAVYQLGDRWAVDVPDLHQTIQLDPEQRVQIFRETE